MGSSDGNGKTLVKGENGYAYYPGLSDTSNSSLPIVVDGFAGGSGAIAAPAYTATKTDKGGVWAGKNAIVVHVDQSAEKVKLDPKTFYLTRKDPTSASVNYFAKAASANDPDWIPNDPVNPE